MRYLAFGLLFISVSLPIWAVCAQASPADCPQYMAVACHPSADTILIEQDNTMASIELLLNGETLEYNAVACDELPDGGGTGPDNPQECSMHWWLCDPFAM